MKKQYKASMLICADVVDVSLRSLLSRSAARCCLGRALSGSLLRLVNFDRGEHGLELSEDVIAVNRVQAIDDAVSRGLHAECDFVADAVLEAMVVTRIGLFGCLTFKRIGC